MRNKIGETFKIRGPKSQNPSHVGNKVEGTRSGEPGLRNTVEV